MSKTQMSEKEIFQTVQRNKKAIEEQYKKLENNIKDKINSIINTETALDKEEIVFDESYDYKTKPEMLFEASEFLNKEEFKQLMFAEYDKVKEDPMYFFKNYFKTKFKQTV